VAGIDGLIKQGESEKLEFKKSLAEREEILRTITAFSNTSGGTIIIGIDERKNIIGIKPEKGEIEGLDNSINQLIVPKVYPDFQLILSLV